MPSSPGSDAGRLVARAPLAADAHLHGPCVNIYAEVGASMPPPQLGVEDHPGQACWAKSCITTRKVAASAHC